MSKLKIRLESLPNEININEQDLNYLVEMRDTLAKFSNTQDWKKNARLLIQLASSANELDPRKEYVRNQYKQVPWKNLIYLTKLIPQLLNLENKITKDFVNQFQMFDLQVLIDIFSDMQRDVESNIKHLKSMGEELSAKKDSSFQ